MLPNKYIPAVKEKEANRRNACAKPPLFAFTSEMESLYQFGDDGYWSTQTYSIHTRSQIGIVSRQKRSSRKSQTCYIPPSAASSGIQMVFF